MFGRSAAWRPVQLANVAPTTITTQIPRTIMAISRLLLFPDRVVHPLPPFGQRRPGGLGGSDRRQLRHVRVDIEYLVQGRVELRVQSVLLRSHFRPPTGE